MQFVHILPGTADPRSMDGVNKVVHWMATTQTESGVATQVWALKPSDNPATHERNYPVRVFHQKKVRFVLPDELKEAIAQLPVDSWVQLHSVYVPEMTAIAKLLKKRGIPYGFTPHGGYLSLYFEPQSRRVKKTIFASLWENWMVRHASMIHVIGATEMDDLERRAPGSRPRMALIPNGYTASKMVPREEVEPASIVFCGRHVRQKGLDLLIRGFAQYRKEGGTLRLMLIGGGKESESLHTLARELGVADDITWTGVLFFEELSAKLQGAAAFVHTSRFDVFPTACLEAAGLGVPLLVSGETNFGEYLEPRNAGWVCSPNTPEKIAETMFLVERTLPQERIAMGANARRMIDEELNWNRVCERLGEAVAQFSGHSLRP